MTRKADRYDDRGRSNEPFELRAIGVVESPLSDLSAAPKQGDEGGPDAWLDLDPALADAAFGLREGDRVVILTWLHLADRSVRSVHPRGDPAAPLTGVFATRSPARPNPIGVHEAEVAEIDGARIRVRGLEAIDGTPILDLKPALGPVDER